MIRILSILLTTISIIILVGGCSGKDDNPVIPPVNRPPDAPVNLFPRHHATAQPLDMYVEWRCSDPDQDSLHYDVYFGKTDPPELVVSKTSALRYDTDSLDYESTYNWRVIAYDGVDSTISNMWNFATLPLPNQPPFTPSNPLPVDGAVDQSYTVNLNWEGSDPENDILSYDVYFGSDNPPPLVNSGQRSSSYDLDTLGFHETYYWKIVATDDNDNTTVGGIWSFTTVEETRGTDPGELREFNLGNSGMSVSMVWIPEGSFMMGAQTNEIDAVSDEYPQHEVTFESGFWMGKYEITQEQWTAIMGSNPAFFAGENMPVERVSWEEAHVFIDRLNSGTGSSPFRLPTEAEWEYCCRAGFDNVRFPWGDDSTYARLVRYGWYDSNSEGRTHEIGQKLPNRWGLHDMHGNVWEWCEDWYHDSYNGAPTDGSAWIEIDNGATRVRRGGAWNYGSKECRSAYRFRASPSSRYSSLGLRLVRNAE